MSASSLDLTPRAAEVDELAARLAAHKLRPRAKIHAFHRWYGKLIPAIPAAAIEAFTRPGDLVVDPFCGSGTVLVEGRLAGRAAFGCDVNPLAALLARVKTRSIEPAVLEGAARRLLRRFRGDPGVGWEDEAPAMPNRAHFYPPEVCRDLVRLLRAARAERSLPLREFFLALVSAINRDVSNADTRHVFPGVSKRMRALLADGWTADVPARFERALAARLGAAAALHARAASAPQAVVVEGSAADLPVAPGSAALIVTNPPYLSSLRYVETFKLEAWWLGSCHDGGELRALDARCLGTERLAADERASLSARVAGLPAACRAEVADLVERGQPMAAVVARFAEDLSACARAMAAALRDGGWLVAKLAPSRVRGVSVDTPALLAEVLAPHGVELRGTLLDGYTASRSLTRARNWYSGRMDADHLLLFRKAGPR